MSGVTALPQIKEQSIEVVVIRADGTVEDLGVVSYRGPNIFVTFAWYLRHPEQWAHKCCKFLRWIGVMK